MYTSIKKIISAIVFLTSATSVFSQTDTTFWSNNLHYMAENKSGQSQETHFHIAHRTLPRHSEATEPIQVQIYSLNDSSWFSPDAPDTLEQKIFFLLYCKAEQWRRETNLWLWENGDMPKDYQFAMIEHQWELLLKNIEKTKKQYYNTDSIAIIDLEISKTLLSIYEFENNEERSATSAFGYGMDFFLATGKFDNLFSTPRGIGIGLQFTYRKTALNLEGCFLYSSVNQEFEANNTAWIKDQRVQHGIYSLQIQRKVLDKKRYSITPYAGIALSEVVPSDSASNSNLSYKKTQRLHNSSYIVGVNTDIKLIKKTELVPQETRPSYWFLRVSFFYAPLYAEEAKSQFLGLKIGLGGFSKFTN